ncbi:penicillin-binding protein [Clostridiaceae bacterium]|nr:penicillin-binding protein [Clostridiaceae bacterium]
MNFQKSGKKRRERKWACPRIVILFIVFFCMFTRLVVRLYELQIINGEQYLNNYLQMTTKELDFTGVRGNIYDRNGNELAYNELAYIVMFRDNGQCKSISEKNKIFLKLVQILNQHGNKVSGKLEIAVYEHGEMYFTSTSEISHKRFLCNIFGLKSPEQLTGPDGKFPSNISAEELFKNRYHYYKLDEIKDKKGNPVLITPEEALQVMDIWYTTGLTSYKKYEAVKISSYIDTSTMADILEHMDELPGVDAEETTIRKYNDSIYFSPIIGYVGNMQESQLELLRQENPEYEPDDIVGKSGIERTMETTLQGTKGHLSVYVDNVGHIREVISQTAPKSGCDVYLTIDRDLQKGIYHLIEQQLAGVLASKLINAEDNINKNASGSSRMIPLKSAWFQLINNGVISTKHLKESTADAEVRIFETFLAARTEAFKAMRNELYNSTPTAQCQLPEDIADYMFYVVSYLSSGEQGIIKTEEIDKSSREYLAWKDGTGNLREYLYNGIEEGWIYTSSLNIEQKYSDLENIFHELLEYTLKMLENDSGFEKEIYRHLIENGTVTGSDLLLALYSQGILAHNEEEICLLETQNEDYAFQLIKEKIIRLELTPAQMALEPCTAGVVVTDVNTGKILALVTYPGYDGNRLSGTIDAAYYKWLLHDLSNPLYNKATQVLKAPASTFKPIMAVAALEEGAVEIEENVNCTGLYDQAILPIKCWIYPGKHGEETITEAIQNSCNYYFAELGKRLSIDENGNYNPDCGIDMIRKYAGFFGLDHTSGVEIPETDPHITTEDPERSAMGQATHAYTNIQLSRYVTAIANRGTVYEFSLIDRIVDPSGGKEPEYPAPAYTKLDFSETTWDIVQEGMRRVIANNSSRTVRKLFQDLEVPIAGKTGTTQESKSHANHAFFISYGPYDNPEIAVTVNIPNGYTSGNAASLAKNVYRLYFGYLDLENIMARDAGGIANINNID